MVNNIGGDVVESETIVPIGSDPHLYEPTPADARMVAAADIIFINGMTFEGWITELVQNSGTKAQMIRITEGIEAIASEKYKNSSDPHAWMDASNGLVYIKNIKKALVQIAPQHTALFEKNYASYRDQLMELDEYIASEVQKIPVQQRVLITSHDAFAYYGKRYDLQLNAIMGVSTESEARTSDIIRVSNAIKEAGVPAVFIESTINPKLLKQIAVDNNVVIGGELYADSIGSEGSEGDSYLKMLKHNTDVIVAALSKTSVKQSDKPNNDSLSQGEHTMLYYLIGAIVLIGALMLWIKFRVNG
jgi:ABC-type Zn uptake system ZnuABC Zn-binding protein ZnuA